MADPAVGSVTAFVGGSAMNSGRLMVSLETARPKGRQRRPGNWAASQETGHRSWRAAFPTGDQDIRVGGRQANSQYQYTLESEDIDELNRWAPIVCDKLKTLPELRDVSTDQQVPVLKPIW